MKILTSEDVLDIRMPETDPVPVVLDSPHSGTVYPDDFRYSVGMDLLRYGVDFEIDDLFGSGPAFGATLIAARFPRSYIDPNRSPADIDAGMIDGTWPHEIQPSQKTETGHGLIWRTVGMDQAPVYDRLLSVSEVENRIEKYWRPYRNSLTAHLDKTADAFGGYWHINCHSMPSVWPNGFEGTGEPVPFDMIIGTRDNDTCSHEVASHARGLLAGLGFSVAVNVGFKGVDLVRDHGNPSANRHSLQIEINRGLYMDETTFERSAGYEPLRDAMTQFLEAFTEGAAGHFGVSTRRKVRRSFHTS